MLFFPFVLVCIASGLVDSAVSTWLEAHEPWGFVVTGVAIALTLSHNPKRWPDILFGVMILSASSCIDVAVSDAFATIVPTAITIPVSLGAGFLCILFCIWWIPDEYGFNLLVIYIGFDSWPDKGRPAIYPIVHQLVFFCAAAFIDVGLGDIMQNAHWAWSMTLGIVCTALFSYMFHLRAIPVLLYTLTCSGLDIGYSSVLWSLSRGHVWAQFFLGFSAGFTLLLLVFGLGYVLEPHHYKWKFTSAAR